MVNGILISYVEVLNNLTSVKGDCSLVTAQLSLHHISIL